MNFAEGNMLSRFTTKVIIYNLSSSALVLFGVTPMHLMRKYWLQAQIFKIPASYRPGRWNTGHLTNLPRGCHGRAFRALAPNLFLPPQNLLFPDKCVSNLQKANIIPSLKILSHPNFQPVYRPVYGRKHTGLRVADMLQVSRYPNLALGFVALTHEAWIRFQVWEPM